MAEPPAETGICYTPATDLAEHIRNGDLSPSDVTDAYLTLGSSRPRRRHPSDHRPVQPRLQLYCPAWQNDDGYLILNKSKIHDRVYHNPREETDLPANLCVRGYSKAVEAMKSPVADWKKGISRPLPRFTESSAVYDKRTLTIKDRSTTLSTINGRVAVDYVRGDYQRSYLDDDDYEKRMGTLHYREDEEAFYLHIVIKKEVEERINSQYFAGAESIYLAVVSFSLMNTRGVISGLKFSIRGN